MSMSLLRTSPLHLPRSSSSAPPSRFRRPPPLGLQSISSPNQTSLSTRSSDGTSSSLPYISISSLFQIPLSRSQPHRFRVSIAEDCVLDRENEDLGQDGEVFRKTLRLVECAMLASVAGLTYILSNTLAIENYFGCFFSFPIVISSMRWGAAAGRKTMVATAMLLLTLSGPVKASTYLLMHGLVGLAMGSLWRLRVNWGLSVLFCTFVRMIGAVGYVLLSSFLIRENILYLIAINIHASLMNALAVLGINTVISMETIYAIFGSVLLLNCTFFVLLLHILYVIFLSKLGMRESLNLPRWLQNAL